METITLNRKEQQRIIVLNRVESRELTAAQAGELMGLSVRQVRRLLAAYRREGVVAIAHGNRGRRPPHTVSEAVRERVVALAAGPYDGANHTHLSELMAEREGLFLSRSTVRRVLLQAGIKTPRRRRAPKHRRRRERYPQEGMMLQVDGSRHDWLQGRGPWLTLIGGIDDATGTAPYGCFREQEDSYGYMQLLQGVIQRKGIPLTLYSDRHSTFTVSRAQNETLEEQLTGQTPQTQVGRALNELGVRLVLAHSPQAKGRIERLWGTFQDRLLMELRLAGASTLEEANAVLADFLPRFNSRFGVPAAQPGAAYQCVPAGTDLAGILCFKYQRTVAADNTVRFEGRTLQILPDPHRASYARARVEVQLRLDGELIVTYQGRALLSQDAAPGTTSLRAQNRPQRNGNQDTARGKAPIGDSPLPRKPAPHHPWRRPFKSPARTNSLNT